VYRKKSKFTAEEVFLIHQGGTLITHLSRHQQANVDDIIFSGMFTAVQDFIKDTFTQEGSDGAGGANEDWALDELKLGDNNILIERSENTYLAVIFSGEGSKRLRRIVIKLLENIENKYSGILPTWDGNISQLEGTKEILSVLIKLKEKPEKEQKADTTLGPPKHEIKPTLPLYTSHAPQVKPTQIITQAPTIRSTPIPTVKATIESKELLECTGKQTGARLPGLISWPLKSKKAKGKGKKIQVQTSGSGFGARRFGLERLPMALDIGPHKSRVRTVVIKKQKQPTLRPQQAVQGRQSTSPMGLDNKKSTQSFTINVQNKDKVFKVDPSRSLLQQLAEMDDQN
jgi:hypothetical protein